MIAHFYIFARNISIEIENASLDSCNAKFVDEIVYIKIKSFVITKKCMKANIPIMHFFLL